MRIVWSARNKHDLFYRLGLAKFRGAAVGHMSSSPIWHLEKGECGV